jgi:hypothetical protein
LEPPRLSPRTTRTLPTIEPIIPVLGSPPLQAPQWIYEPKFDGFRGLLYLRGRECFILSRRGKVLRRFGELAQRLRAELAAPSGYLSSHVHAALLSETRSRLSYDDSNAADREASDSHQAA